MDIRKLMDMLNKEAGGESASLDGQGERQFNGSADENVVYIDNARLETATDQSERKALLSTTTQWADRIMGEILVDLGKLRPEDVGKVLEYQREHGVYFGEAATALKLVEKEDVLHALSSQFGYTYNRDENSLSRDLVMAYSPFESQAEEFRTIRGHLVGDWLSTEQKTLAVVSPQSGDGRSYVAANLALAFSQLGHSTLLIDANLRTPSLHKVFDFNGRIGLSMLLAGRVKMQDLDVLPDQVSGFQHLSVLGSGAVPPNPAELLGRGVLPLILRELRKYFDVIIIDTPPAGFQADILSIVSAAGSALMVTRAGHTRLEESQALIKALEKIEAKVVGAVLNQY